MEIFILLFFFAAELFAINTNSAAYLFIKVHQISNVQVSDSLASSDKLLRSVPMKEEL
jgi:hypothetical protein